MFSEKQAKKKISEPLFVMTDQEKKTKPKQAVSTSFKFDVQNSEVRAYELMSQSTASLKSGDIDKAVKEADCAVAVCPEIADVYINACSIRSSLEDKLYIYDYAARALSLWPSNNEVFINYLKCSLAVGKISGEKCQDIIDRFPYNDSDMRVVVAYVWEKSNVNEGFSRVLSKHLEYIRSLSVETIALIGSYLFANKKKKDSLVLARDLIDNKKTGLIKKYKLWYGYVNEIFSISSSEYDKKTLKLTSKIINDASKFESMLKDSKRVVVVGNSPCEIGKSKGKNIDEADLVIRFNNYPENKEFIEDYGAKTDVWVRSVGAWVEERELDKFSAVVLSATNPMNRGFQDRHFYDHLESNNLFSIFPESYQYELISLLGGPPSAGLMMIYWLYKIRGGVSKDDLFGFGFIDQLESTVENVGKSPAGVRHNWTSELDIFEKLICGDGI